MSLVELFAFPAPAAAVPSDASSAWTTAVTEATCCPSCDSSVAACSNEAATLVDLDLDSFDNLAGAFRSAGVELAAVADVEEGSFDLKFKLSYATSLNERRKTSPGG